MSEFQKNNRATSLLIALYAAFAIVAIVICACTDAA